MKNILIILILSLCTISAWSAEVDSLSETSYNPLEDEAYIASGKKLFKENCKSCHHLTQKLTGPALRDVRTRKSDEWIISFVKNSQAVIASGDRYADSLYKAFNNTLMPNQNLKDEEIIAILDYFDYEKQQAAISPPLATPTRQFKRYYKPLKFTDYHWWLIYTLFFFLLIWGLYTLIDINEFMQKEDQLNG